MRTHEEVISKLRSTSLRMVCGECGVVRALYYIFLTVGSELLKGGQYG